MRAAVLAVLCVALFATATLAASDNSDVVILDSTNFDSEVSSGDLTLVEFFAPWCGHCKSLAPNYAKAATQLKGTAKLASVDCTVHKDLCSRFGVQGFPTLKIFRASGDINKPAEYQGGRSEKDIVRTIRKQLEPSVTTITTVDERTTFTKKDGIEVIGVFADLESNEAKLFKQVAEELRNDYTFAISSNADVAAAGVPSVTLYKGDEPSIEPVSSEDASIFESASSLKTWISAEAFELVGEIGPENFQKYIDRGLPLVWSFVDYSDAAKDATKSLLSKLTDAAKAVKGKLSVVKLDGQRWAEHAKHFGLTSVLPGIVVEDRQNNKNYIYPQDSEVSADSLSSHFQGFLKGTLKANLKSQPEPADNTAPVKVLVGSSFERIVMDDAKDVFVEFYAPWCGHCKSLAPKWDSLGEQFASDSNIVIAKVDATENDTPARIEGFPTLIFYPAGDKSNPITFEGDRSVDAMATFVRDNRQSAPAAADAQSTTTDNKDEL